VPPVKDRGPRQNNPRSPRSRDPWWFGEPMSNRHRRHGDRRGEGQDPTRRRWHGHREAAASRTISAPDLWPAGAAACQSSSWDITARSSLTSRAVTLVVHRPVVGQLDVNPGRGRKLAHPRSCTGRRLARTRRSLCATHGRCGRNRLIRSHQGCTAGGSSTDGRLQLHVVRGVDVSDEVPSVVSDLHRSSMSCRRSGLCDVRSYEALPCSGVAAASLARVYGKAHSDTSSVGY